VNQEPTQDELYWLRYQLLDWLWKASCVELQKNSLLSSEEKFSLMYVYPTRFVASLNDTEVLFWSSQLKNGCHAVAQRISSGDFIYGLKRNES
jgi:hypothetical protein